jgi:hypothetical protein
MPDRPYCLPGCNRLDGHDGRDIGACMGAGGRVLYPGPLDLTRRHPDIPVNVPLRRRYTVEDAAEAILAAESAPRYSPYFGTRPPVPPLPSRCYQSEYGFTVHIRGACEC